MVKDDEDMDSPTPRTTSTSTERCIDSSGVTLAAEPPRTPSAPEPGAEGETRYLDPGIRTVWRVAGLLRAVIAGVAVAVTMIPIVVTERAPYATLVVPVVVAVFGAVFAWWWPAVRYRHWTYRIGADTMELEHGVVFRTRSVIPYFRVQHVDTSQGPIDRRLSLSNLKVQTAS